MATTIVSRTQSGAESAAGRRTWTFSCWFKKTKIISGGSNQELFGSDSNGARSNNYNIIDFNSNDNLDVNGYQSGATFRKITNRRFRDCNAWYHLVVAFDTTQSTADDRIKIYINGVRETSFSTSTNPSQDHQGKIFAQNKVHAFGRGSGQGFNGIISHCHATEGTAYAPTVFGSTDSTTGEWKINTSPNVSYGTNGFFLFKDDNSVNNQAGNSSGNFAVTAGTLTKSEDCPSNVFATFNPLYNPGGSSFSFSNGNTKFEESQNQWKTTFSTLSAASGKYYAEFKCNGNWMMVGVADMTRTFYGINDRNFASTTYISEQGYGYYNANGDLYYRGSSTSYGATYGSGDIVQVALDCDNNRVFFGKNGTWQNSADPTSAGTGFSMTATNARYAFAASVQQDQIHANFGNGYFSTTAVSSAGTNASNNGIFEYDVPSGYTALSTKGLNL